MEIFAFANQKGGVGKSTVTVALAAALARRRVRSLVIDLDPQASLTKLLGIETDGRRTVADALLEPERFSLRDARRGTTWGFDVAPAETALASREVRRSTGDEFLLRRQLEELDACGVVLIDCPPSLGLLTLNALVAASRLVIVTEPTFLALQGIDELLETQRLVRRHYNPDLELAGVIVNRAERTVEHRASVREIVRCFGDGLVWRPHVPKRTVLQDAAREGVCRSTGSPATPRPSCATRSRRSRSAWRRPVRPREPRAALAARKDPRPHPALPVPAAGDVAGGPPPAPATDRRRDGEIVMFCVRVPRSLRRRIKIAAAQTGISVQALGLAALEAECRRRGV